MAEFMRPPRWVEPFAPRDVLQLLRIMAWISAGQGVGCFVAGVVGTAPLQIGMVCFNVGGGVFFSAWLTERFVPAKFLGFNIVR